MSKAEDEVVSVMSETEWLSLPQIIEKAKLKSSTTRVTVCRLAIQERIIKRERPDGTMLRAAGLASVATCQILTSYSEQ